MQQQNQRDSKRDKDSTRWLEDRVTRNAGSLKAVREALAEIQQGNGDLSPSVAGHEFCQQLEEVKADSLPEPLDKNSGF